MNKKYGKFLLFLVALISIGTAIAHMSCILLGPQCYAVQMAPPEIIESAKNGTLLAPIGASIVSLLFVVVALYSMSSAGVIKKLPFLSVGVYVISILCVVRGVATIPSSFIFPEMVSTFSILAGIVWFSTGIMLYLGHKNVRQHSI